jgi:hypothetical protein
LELEEVEMEWEEKGGKGGFNEDISDHYEEDEWNMSDNDMQLGDNKLKGELAAPKN